ncbi:MAG: formyltransferase [Candidatus Paracaedibacteraceae bacterium]|nr:formyltransferase [Candidatus Paracaedibacteraceae bacterium]
MRCLVFAYSQLGHDCLKYIIEKTGYTVVCVITHEDSPSEHIWFDSVKALAQKHKIDVLTPESLKNETIQNQINAYNADVLLSFYYRNMIPEVIFSKPPLGAYNMHGSLLPKYRGRCPVNWAIINGETKTGVTLHHMLKTADAGDIVAQAETEISFEDTAGAVMSRLNTLAVNVLKQSLPRIASQTAFKIVQNASESSYFGGRSSKDGQINWSKSAADIHNLVRALQPTPQYPAAFGDINKTECNIIKSMIVENSSTIVYKPGTVIQQFNDTTYYIACGANGDEILCVIVEAKEAASH